MKIKILLSILLVLLLLPSLVTATVTVTVSQSGADAGSVMAGKSFTVTASGWSGSCNSAYIDLSNCGACNISESQSKGISGSSVSWTTLTATKASSQSITVSISGACTPESGSTSFDVKNAPSLSATVSPTSTSVQQGSTFTLSLNIQNSGETTAQFGSITVSPSDFSISSGCSPSSISGGQSAGLSCTISASSSATAGTRTVTLAINPTNADSLQKTIAVTVSSAAGTTGTTEAAGGATHNRTTTTTTRATSTTSTSTSSPSASQTTTSTTSITTPISTSSKTMTGIVVVMILALALSFIIWKKFQK